MRSLLLSFFLFGALLRGAIVPGQCTYDVPSVALTSASPSATAQLTCPQFDTGLGNLTQVTLLVAARSLSGSVMELNNTTGAVLPGPMAPLLTVLTMGPLPGQPAATVGTRYHVAFFINVSPGVATYGESFLQDGPFQFSTGLAAFGGTGTFQVPVSFETRVNPGNPAGLSVVSFSGGLDLSTPMDIYYTYDAVPEPGTAAMMAGVLALAALYGRSAAGGRFFRMGSRG